MITNQDCNKLFLATIIQNPYRLLGSLIMYFPIGMSKLKHLPSFDAYREFIMKNAETMKLDKMAVKDSADCAKR